MCKRLWGSGLRLLGWCPSRLSRADVRFCVLGERPLAGQIVAGASEEGLPISEYRYELCRLRADAAVGGLLLTFLVLPVQLSG